MKDKCLKGMTRYSHFISAAGILVNWAGRMPSDSCCPTATPEAPFSSGKAKQPKVHMLTFFRKHTSQKQHSRRPQSVIKHTHTHIHIQSYQNIQFRNCISMPQNDGRGLLLSKWSSSIHFYTKMPPVGTKPKQSSNVLLA